MVRMKEASWASENRWIQIIEIISTVVALMYTYKTTSVSPEQIRKDGVKALILPPMIKHALFHCEKGFGVFQKINEFTFGFLIKRAHWSHVKGNTSARAPAIRKQQGIYWFDAQNCQPLEIFWLFCPTRSESWHWKIAELSRSDLTARLQCTMAAAEFYAHSKCIRWHQDYRWNSNDEGPQVFG